MTGPGVEREPGPGLESRQAAGGEAGAGPGDQGVQPGDLAGAGQGGAGEGVGPGQEAGQLLQQEGGGGAAGGEERQEVQQGELGLPHPPQVLLAALLAAQHSQQLPLLPGLGELQQGSEEQFLGNSSDVHGAAEDLRQAGDLPGQVRGQLGLGWRLSREGDCAGTAPTLSVVITHCCSDHLHLLLQVEPQDAYRVAHLVLEVGGENKLVVILHTSLGVRRADQLTGDNCAGHRGTSHTRVAQPLPLLLCAGLSLWVVTDGQKPLRTGRERKALLSVSQLDVGQA